MWTQRELDVMKAASKTRWILATMSAVLCAWLTSAPLAQADAPDTLASLVFITEEYPPYNYVDNQQLAGISVELLEEMFAATNVV